jgi:hypothetical protein
MKFQDHGPGDVAAGEAAAAAVSTPEKKDEPEFIAFSRAGD